MAESAAALIESGIVRSDVRDEAQDVKTNTAAQQNDCGDWLIIMQPICALPNFAGLLNFAQRQPLAIAALCLIPVLTLVGLPLEELTEAIYKFTWVDHRSATLALIATLGGIKSWLLWRFGLLVDHPDGTHQKPPTRCLLLGSRSARAPRSC